MKWKVVFVLVSLMVLAVYGVLADVEWNDVHYVSKEENDRLSEEFWKMNLNGDFNQMQKYYAFLKHSTEFDKKYETKKKLKNKVEKWNEKWLQEHVVQT